MAENDTKVKVILTIPPSELESLRSFLDFSGGQILKETTTRKRKLEEGEEKHKKVLAVQNAECPTSYNIGRLRDTKENDAATSCEYCLQKPCVTVPSEEKASVLRAYGPPRMQNIAKRYRNYREFYKILKNARLWHNPAYVNRKCELGIFIDDVREVMPNCVVSDVRKRWPNPTGVPYKGHVPTAVV